MIDSGSPPSTGAAPGDSCPVSAPKATPRPRRRLVLLSPTGMLILAGIIAAAFGVCHLMGLRENVSVVFATSGTASIGRFLGGAAYVLLYLATITGCPILVLAGGIHAVMNRVWRG